VSPPTPQAMRPATIKANRERFFILEMCELIR